MHPHDPWTCSLFGMIVSFGSIGIWLLQGSILYQLRLRSRRADAHQIFVGCTVIATQLVAQQTRG
jgi:hypothetical protein